MSLRRLFAHTLVCLPLVASGCGDSGSSDDTSSSIPDPDDLLTEQSYGPRQLRLLTRREYEATVRDLFGFGASASPEPGPTCEVDADCSISTESCVGSSCAVDACEVVTFLLPAAQGTYGSVVIAGSFNGWGSNEAAGGWPMTYEPSLGAWVAKRAVADGTWSYKFVADGSTWMADPGNPASEPDGFGGQNSLVTRDCVNAPPPPSGGDAPGEEPVYSKDFPVETRPQHHPFDNAAASGLVTSIHVEQTMRAAERIAARVTTDLPALLECDAAGASDPCVRAFVERFGRRAFRRPLSAVEVDKYVGLVASQGELASGVGVALEVMLSSPYFLYRSEVGEAQPDGTAKLDAYEIATALSYTFWGTTPDDTLLDVAETGGLDTPEGIEAEARRLLADPRARAVVGEFAMQWLGVERVVSVDKNAALFPEFDDELRTAAAEETRRFVESIVFDGGRFDDLFLADTTSAGGRLAELYGASAEGFLPEDRHAGLLAHASVLASYAHSDQTSPVRRGLFVRERLLCNEFAVPPANAGAVPEIDPSSTTRERFEQHAADPTCNACHRFIDPVGFGFERFDPIGRLRSEDGGQPVDPSGMVEDLEGSSPSVDRAFASLPELGAILVESDKARSCFATQVHRFASGYHEEEVDRGTLAYLADELDRADGDVRELLVAVTKTKGFVWRKSR
jgi:hypothetical protein